MSYFKNFGGYFFIIFIFYKFIKGNFETFSNWKGISAAYSGTLLIKIITLDTVVV